MTIKADALARQTFRTSRLLEYFSEKELTLQTGHGPERWPEVVVKELVDNALDACEEHDVLPDIHVAVGAAAVTVADNGPGLPADVLRDVLDYSVRVSSRDYYISPSRGQQGNALKTVLAIPFCLDESAPQTVTITSRGERHTITVAADRIAQAPRIGHTVAADPSVKTGTRITVPLPWLEPEARAAIFSLVEGYSVLNPAASFTVAGESDLTAYTRTATAITKWRPQDPTSPHWYAPAQLRALMAACVAAERQGGPAWTVRDFLGQFRGLSSTVKRKAILEAVPAVAGRKLSECVVDGDLDEALVADLWQAMRAATKPVDPLALGVLGQAHLRAWLQAHGGVEATVQYKRVAGIDDTTGLPFVFEFAFGARQDHDGRRLLVGINAAPTLTNPFRSLGAFGISLDGLLNRQYITASAPVTCVAHLTCPHLRFTDRGKSSLEAL